MILKRRYNVMLKPRSMDILEEQSRKLEVSRSSLIDKIIDDYIFDNGLFDISDISDVEMIEGQEVLTL